MISCVYSNCKNEYQVIKYVSLMYMDSDECLKLGAVQASELFCCLFNQFVENSKKFLIGKQHGPFVTPGLGEGFLRIHGPDHLENEQSYL